MAFEDQLQTHWWHELPFYSVAMVSYVVLFIMNPPMNWGGHQSHPAEKNVPIEFVAQMPPTSLNLAPPPKSDVGSKPPPAQKRDKVQPAKLKKGAKVKPKNAPLAKPAAVKSQREKSGATVDLDKLEKIKAKKAAAAEHAEIARIKAEEDRQEKARILAEKKFEAQQRAEEARAERERLDEQMRIERAQKAEEARLEKERRAEMARVEREQREEAARAERERRAEAARVAREERLAAERARQEQLAAERAAKAQKKAELSHELAAMSDPDEVIADAAEARPLAPVRGSSRAKNSGPARASGVQIGGRPTSSRAGAAAALAETSSESLEPGDTPGDGGSDLITAPSHGTEMPDGNGVSYLLDGPVGNRQLLKRAVPSSPDWVGTRGLDLTVTVRFQVTADGRVKPGAVIQKTSGFPEIDQRALKALRQWRFKPVAAGGSEVWGRVTFRFTS